MIKIDGHNTIDVRHGGRLVDFIYKGVGLVWQRVKAALSCYGTGRWIQNLPWVDNDTWKND